RQGLRHGDQPHRPLPGDDRGRRTDHQLGAEVRGGGGVPAAGSRGDRAVSRRARLPGASELFFRKTTDIAGTDGSSGSKPRVPRRGSPRVKHDTKITVYLSQQELLALEQARLTLRAEHDLRVDRGRLVRE